MKKTNSILALALALTLCATLFTGCATAAPAAEPSAAPQTAAIQTEAPATEAPQPAAGTLYLKVNPEIAVTYDANGIVTGITPRNKDAENLGLDYSGYVGKDCRTVVSDLVGAIGDAGYFVEEIEGGKRTITLEIEAGSVLPSREFLKDIVADVQKKVQEHDWRSPLQVQGATDYDMTDYGITDYGPGNDGYTDYNDTDYGPNSDGITDYTDYGAGKNTSTTTPTAPTAPTVPTAPTRGHTDYGHTDYGATDYGRTDYDSHTNYGDSDYR